MSQYARGTRFEHDVRDHLKGQGYTVLRSAGSKTKVDLVAWKFGEVLFIQCKTGKSAVGTDEWNQVYAAGHAVPSCRSILARKIDGQKEPVYWEVMRPRLPRARAVEGVHWRPWWADTVVRLEQT